MAQATFVFDGVIDSSFPLNLCPAYLGLLDGFGTTPTVPGSFWSEVALCSRCFFGAWCVEPIASPRCGEVTIIKCEELHFSRRRGPA